jgi:hypothetical protein
VSETIESLRAERDAAITRESVLRDALAKASGVLDVITHAEGCDVDDDDENGTALECSCGLNDILASVNAALAHSGSKADTSILICLTVSEALAGDCIIPGSTTDECAECSAQVVLSPSGREFAATGARIQCAACSTPDLSNNFGSVNILASAVREIITHLATKTDNKKTGGDQ